MKEMPKVIYARFHKDGPDWSVYECFGGTRYVRSCQSQEQVQEVANNTSVSELEKTITENEATIEALKQIVKQLLDIYFEKIKN